MLRYDVQSTLFRIPQICEGVLCTVPSSGKTKNEKWRVVVDELKVGKGRKVGGRACSTSAHRFWVE